MEGVEDIPAPVMHEGLTWQWESFSEYLAVLKRRNRDIDIACLLPHAAVRVYVMGDRAIRHEKATEADIARMRRITSEAVSAGAFGFSTSRTLSHRSLSGEYTPTLRAHEDELTGIALGMRDAGAGFLEIVSDWNDPDPESEFAMLRRVVEACGRPAVFSLAQHTLQQLAGVWLVSFSKIANEQQSLAEYLANPSPQTLQPRDARRT